MKKTILTILTLILTVTLGVHVADALGTLTVPANPGSATQYSLNDIYNKLTDFTISTSTKTGLFIVPGTVAPTFFSLSDIYTKLTNENANLVPAKIATGTTIFGVTGTLQGAHNLEWSTSEVSTNFNTAYAFCSGIVDGSTGWRLPTFSELLVGISNDWIPSGSGTIFINGEIYWTSGYSGSDDDWVAYWSTGSINSARCVR
jgi:hypothetical protein